MTDKHRPGSRLDQVLAEQREYIARREQGYRERALKLYPWICGRCGREFERRNLTELTVHHIDHNHDNNPADGSNWELLCLYCHDEEHTRFENLVRYGDTADRRQKAATFNPFADLKQLLDKTDDEDAKR